MKKVFFKDYVISQGYTPIRLWEVPAAMYAEVKEKLHSPRGFTQIFKDKNIVRLSKKDINNPEIVGKEVEVFFENLKSPTNRIGLLELIRDIVRETSATGTGSSVTTGQGEQYTTSKAFKKRPLR